MAVDGREAVLVLESRLCEVGAVGISLLITDAF